MSDTSLTPSGEFLIYQTEDGLTRIEAKKVNESVWLTQAQMTALFQKEKSTISEHISNVYDDGELDRAATVRKFRTVQTEGERQVQREIEHYNLDVIISVEQALEQLKQIEAAAKMQKR